mgnify:CR=1 FL=1
MATVRQTIQAAGYNNLRELLANYANDVKAAKRYYQTAESKAENSSAISISTNKIYSVEAVA